MANRYYAPGADRAARVNDLFATIAPRYDLINDLQSFGLHRAWKRKLVRLAEGRPGHLALDVCCGTGDVTFALAEAGLETIGLDFSEAMLAVARDRNARRHHGNQSDTLPRFLQGDAQQIPFPNASFDVITVSYGLRNLARWQTGLAEMFRVAKPAGRLLVLDFGKPDNALWRSIYFTYLRIIVPIFGRIFCGDSQTHSYILESLRLYPAQHGVAEEMRRLGCGDVRIINLLGGIMTINCGRKPPFNQE
jgi:demethylmenaquinone methyltransferase/2-methoxy-6-polyprenyl-1,4-benzoquinol methylase